MRRWLGFLGTALLLLLCSVHPAYADETKLTIFSVTQQDLNGDGKPDLTVIDCTFATDHDRIYVYDQGNDMTTSSDWQKATDFNDDTWLYDIGADGTIQLIVKYQVGNAHDTAYLYDDQDGDGQVKYELTGTQVKVLESSYWTARITSNADWFLPDGHINLNVRIQLDGPIPTLDRADPGYIQGWMKHDGQTDVEFEEVADSGGKAQYALRRLLAPSPPDWGFERAWLWSNEGHYPTDLPERAFFPFLYILDSSDPRYWNLRYFDLPANVGMDWSHGRIVGVGLPGYPIEQGYHFNSNRYIVKGQVNDPSFESPQAYYDLANNRDGNPELHIRFFTRPADDPTTWFPAGTFADPWQSISYSWILRNGGVLKWDFKLGLGGNYRIDSVVQFPDFAVHTVPYAQLPYWITERQWKLATFVAREGEGYPSTEGIYEWQTDTGDDPENNAKRAFEARDVSFGYMQGITSTPPDAYFTNAPKGYRAERHFSGPMQPYLYFSPLDHKLHLRGAEFGVWNIDDQTMIRYANLDGDAYLDQWQYLENARLQRELDAAKDYLIYAGEGEVLLKQVHINPSLFETLPPRNHEEWLSLSDKLQTNEQDFGPGDFKGLVKQFVGPEMQITGGSLRDYRPIGDQGFRFVLTLQPGFSVQGDNLFAVRELKPDDYVVTYNGQFSIDRLTPPMLFASLAGTTLTQLESSDIRVVLRNDGLQDLPQATFELWATPPHGAARKVATQPLTLLAQTPVTATFQWAPPLAGTWTLTPKVLQPNGQLITLEPAHVTVLPASPANPIVMLKASTSPGILFFTISGLLAFATLAASILWQSWRSDQKEHDDAA